MGIMIGDGRVSAHEPTDETAVLCLAHFSVALSCPHRFRDRQVFRQAMRIVAPSRRAEPFLTVSCVRTRAAAGSFSRTRGVEPRRGFD
jgi:hypothetical protein